MKNNPANELPSLKQKLSQPSKKTIFKNGSTTYYYSSLFFHGQVKEDVFTLYAYVRTIDDFVDQIPADTTQFDDYWQLTQKAWSGQQVENTTIADFVSLAKRKTFSWNWIEAFWQAMRQDINKKNYTNYTELEAYMYGSAEVIGLMMARIMDLPEAAQQTAALQGRAMQLINFIRDVAEDEQLGRNYLGYTLQQKNNPKSWHDFIKPYLAKYNHIQEQASTGYSFLSRSQRIPIETAATMYNWTAQQIAQNTYIVWQKKVKPSKQRVIFTCLLTTLKRMYAI